MTQPAPQARPAADHVCAEIKNVDHTAIKRRRRSNRSPRRYACSTLLLTECASAISATSLGKLVRSAAQSRNVERKPCDSQVIAFHSPQQHQECHVAQRVAAFAAREHMRFTLVISLFICGARATELFHFLEDSDDPGARRSRS